MVDDFTRRRWERARDATESTPIEAARMFLADIESGKIKPTQVALVFTEENSEGDTAVSAYNAGPKETLAIQGMLGRAMAMLNP